MSSGLVASVFLDLLTAVADGLLVVAYRVTKPQPM